MQSFDIYRCPEWKQSIKKQNNLITNYDARKWYVTQHWVTYGKFFCTISRSQYVARQTSSRYSLSLQVFCNICGVLLMLLHPQSHDEVMQIIDISTVNRISDITHIENVQRELNLGLSVGPQRPIHLPRKLAVLLNNYCNITV